MGLGEFLGLSKKSRKSRKSKRKSKRGSKKKMSLYGGEGENSEVQPYDVNDLVGGKKKRKSKKSKRKSKKSRK